MFAFRISTGYYKIGGISYNRLESRVDILWDWRYVVQSLRKSGGCLVRSEAHLVVARRITPAYY